MSKERPPYPSPDPSIVEKLGVTKPVGRTNAKLAAEAAEVDEALDAAEAALRQLPKLQGMDLGAYGPLESDPPTSGSLPTTHPERPTDARGVIPKKTNR